MTKLEGQTVIHKAFGKGVIESHTDNKIVVRFTTKTTTFVYPKAFYEYMVFQNKELQNEAIDELNREEEAEEKAREWRRQETISAHPHVSARSTATKKIERLNVAFKCNYCDGGQSATQIGYNGVCSDRIIRNNILVEKRNWCAQPDCECVKYLQHRITRSELEEKCKAEGDFVCYESQMLRDWKAFAGIFHSGSKRGMRMKLKQVQKNSLCILTTREPNQEETSRYVFGVFLVDDAYEGDNDNEGFVSTKSKYKLKLSREQAQKILFWNYYANTKNEDNARWGTGLHRYVDDVIALQVLADVAKVKKGTSDESLANEFLQYFAKLNNADIAKIPEPKGALQLSVV